GDNPDYDREKLALDYVYARRAVLREWVREQGYEPDQMLAYNVSQMTVEERRLCDDYAVAVSLRTWIEAHTGEALSADIMGKLELRELANRVSIRSKWP